MKREEFDKLQILEQIYYINIQLNHSSLKKVCKDIGINIGNIKRRFKKLNYYYNTEQRRYYLAIDKSLEKAS